MDKERRWNMRKTKVLNEKKRHGRRAQTCLYLTLTFTVSKDYSKKRKRMIGAIGVTQKIHVSSQRRSLKKTWAMMIMDR